MAIEGMMQPEYIQIDDRLRLRKYDGKHDFAFEWYQAFRNCVAVLKCRK